MFSVRSEEKITIMQRGTPKDNPKGKEHSIPFICFMVLFLSVGCRTTSDVEEDRSSVEWSNERLLSLRKDKNNITIGQSLFEENCASCHGVQGEGKIGPQLNDEQWLHGGSPMEIFLSIRNGWPRKGMMPWKDILGEEKIAYLTLYVLSLSRPASIQNEPNDAPVETPKSD